MSLFVESEVRARAEQIERIIAKSANRIIRESASEFSKYSSYDVFLSHSIRDAKIILGIKGILEDLGYTVYVDWIEDPQLDRSKVSKKTAEKLRKRMKTSKSLFYVTTENAENSKWMPWECGYFDGFKEKVAIVPVKKSSSNNEYNGQEYLGLYPYAVKEKSSEGDEKLWIYKKKNIYTLYDYWVVTPNKKVRWIEE